MERLQKALDALGSLGGPDAIKRFLKKAQEAARERPVAELVKVCREFIDQSTMNHKVESGVGCGDSVAPGAVHVCRGWRRSRHRPHHSGRQEAVQMVNQFQAERDALSQELRVARPRTQHLGLAMHPQI